MRQFHFKTIFLALFLAVSPAVADEKPSDNRVFFLAETPSLRPAQPVAVVAQVTDTKPAENREQGSNNRFTKGASEFGVQLGWGSAIDLPGGRPRTNWEFAYFFPNYKYNLTGIVGDSFYRGTWSWMAEAGIAEAYHPSTGTVLGFSPLMAEYKFIQPNARLIPYIFGGAGFAFTDWNDKDFQGEIATNFEFLLHAGAGVEFYKTRHGAFSLNYRFFHISNAGIKFPNIGINANMITIGYSFF